MLTRVQWSDCPMLAAPALPVLNPSLDDYVCMLAPPLPPFRCGPLLLSLMHVAPWLFYVSAAELPNLDLHIGAATQGTVLTLLKGD